MESVKSYILADIFESIRSRLGLKTVDELKKYFRSQSHEYNCDFSISLALSENKKTGLPVEKLAEEIKNKMSDLPFIDKIEILNGYVNCTYNYAYLIDGLYPIISDSYGHGPKGDERVMVEHTSVNPNKALHIGHIRNSAIGDSIARLLRFSGKNVIVTNYIDDTGAQVADNVVGIKFFGLPYEKEGVRIDKYLGDEVYVKVNEMYKDDPSLLERRREVLKAIEEGDNDIARFAREMVNKVLISQLKTLERLDVFYNLVNYESHILAYHFWDTAFKQLKEIGAIKLETEGKKKDCWVFPINSKAENDKIIVRSDGTVVYAGKDIAYAMWKHGLLSSDFRYTRLYKQKNGEELWATTLEKGVSDHPIFNAVDTSISVMDARQAYEQDVVKMAVEKLGAAKKIKYIHYGYEVVALSADTAKKLGLETKENQEIFQMSGRKGIYINAEDFLDSLKKKVYEETKAREFIVSEDERNEVAGKLAVSTLRYEMIKTDHNKMITFDIDDALSLEGRNAIYINYTYARVMSILRKSGEKAYPKPDMSRIKLNEHEQNLVNNLLIFPEAVAVAASSLDLSYLANYLSNTAIAINSFYNKVNVLNSEGETLKLRLWLMKSTETVMKTAMSILGIIPIEKM